MIVKMKKLELLLFYKEREQFLESLRTLGVVHVVEDLEKGDNHHIQELQSVIRLCERVERKLLTVLDSKQPSVAQPSKEDATAVLKKFEDLEDELEKINQQIAAFKKDLLLIEPWGQFDPASIKRLADSGVKIRFLMMPVKRFDMLDVKNLPIREISRSGGQVNFVAVERDEQLAIDAEEVRLPEYSIDDLQKKIALLQGKGKEINSQIRDLASSVDVVSKYSLEMSNRLQYERAKEAMTYKADGKLLHMSGWFPVDRENDIKKFFESHSVYFSIQEPSADEDVPIKLKNSKFAKLFEPVTGIYSLPHYLELDTTPFVAPFFTIFFGLCLGDLGYGLLLLIGALFARSKVQAKLKPIISLIVVLALSTMVSGILLNSFFGYTIFGGPGVEGALLPSGVKKFAPLSPLLTEKGQVFPGLSLAIAIGFIQLLFGMAMKSYIGVKNGGLASGIQPVASMMMIVGGLIWAAQVDFLNLGIPAFEVGPVKIGIVLLALPLILGKVLLFSGLVLFLLFNNVDKKIHIRPLIGLYELYNFTSGLLGNILSYLRLFALGLAGGLLGAAFNQIAFLMITKPDGSINYASAGVVGTIIVLIIGHALNLSLSIIGSFVHPLRLTLVEFYGAIGFKGGSKPYRPFTKEQ
ncbi:MAG TPA: V-type ATPase 116kDa subunit family protein [Chitinispirillaceae bacterium]|nr:V-type ATPase 116kDa subunit family protein [Chitinispirillaceae bacterium]